MPIPPGHNRLLKHVLGFVLASLKPSTYQETYASGFRSLRSCRRTCLNSRKANQTQPSVSALPHHCFTVSKMISKSRPPGRVGFLA